jgi:biopolymer transport protein ExbD
MAANLERVGEDLDEVHEINVTPFIDVMLVLLIIFMVAAPLATVDVAVDLPRSTAAATPRPEKPLFLTLRADLSLTLGETPVSRKALGAALDEETGREREERVFLRADRSVDYGAVMEAMNLLRAAGYLKIALVGLETDPASTTPNELQTP